MNIAYTSDNTLNSTVVDTATGNPLYEVCTELGCPGQPQTHSTTTIRDLRGQDKPETVAVWVRAHDRHNDRITINGQNCSLAEWLRKKDVLSRQVHTFDDAHSIHSD